MDILVRIWYHSVFDFFVTRESWNEIPDIPRKTSFNVDFRLYVVIKSARLSNKTTRVTVILRFFHHSFSQFLFLNPFLEICLHSYVGYLNMLNHWHDLKKVTWVEKTINNIDTEIFKRKLFKRVIYYIVTFIQESKICRIMQIIHYYFLRITMY